MQIGFNPATNSVKLILDNKKEAMWPLLSVNTIENQ